jgi:hypothetical protein
MSNVNNHKNFLSSNKIDQTNFYKMIVKYQRYFNLFSQLKI